MPPWFLWLVLCMQRHEVVLVTGTYEPVPLGEADRAVRVLPVGPDEQLLAASMVDFLRLDPSLDLQARAPDGVSSDLSIRGGTFGQTLVLVDGLRMNDAQTGHHDLDIPLPMYALDRIEVLKGAGSAYYGSDAVGGVVNLITETPEATEFRLRTSVGNFGVNEQSGEAAAAWRGIGEQLSFSRDFSSGFAPDRDYRSLALASLTHARSRWGATSLILAYSDRPFGADQFYGPYDSWERTKAWFAAARQELGERTEVSFAYRRHTDLFVLLRDQPQTYSNRHAVESQEASLRRHDPLQRKATVSYGVETTHDAIASNNLGDHARTQEAVYLALDARSLGRFSFSVGGREEFFSGAGRQFSPTANAGYWASSHLRLRASASHAFRLPSYTDLYYSDPTTLGSPYLQPEKAWSYETGLDWNSGGRLRGEVTVFDRRVRDGIDYLWLPAEQIWQATNLDRLNFTGLEAALTLRLAHGQTLALRYSALRATDELGAGVISRYVFNYPSNSGLVAWDGALGRNLVARARVGVMDRRDRSPYAVWDAGLAYTQGRVRPFLRFTNLTNADYQEILGVAMPGRGIVGGLELVLLRGK